MSKELKTCGQCTFFNSNYCMKNKLPVRVVNYACNKFMTDEEWKELVQKRADEKVKANERRLDYILTALMISANSTQMMMERFDSLFADHMVERKWRFERKKAANDIRALCERIRSIYAHTYMVDSVTVCTAGGKQAFDEEKYDNHDVDARNWCLKLLYDIDRCGCSDEAEEKIMTTYEELPENGCFFPEDYKHFANRR